MVNEHEQSRKFTRCVEHFSCVHCGQSVKGNGYTNHCPSCLWSRHVDINPGDRRASCGGMMEPIQIDVRKGIHYILHRCCVCGHEKWNKADAADSYEALLAVARQAAEHRPRRPQGS